ncbi:alpha/beta hydrolase [Paraburkholderia dipogonis]|uniref:Alpha/beta hydrolase n=1 Tax=Paraburkholderia dipogonis TaxID=1211383 RepID=A0A4Y8MKV5_9BURK|nr:alpha/beta hydrolase [Paraburkholderia dipogonis]TFE38062.1 alpha/beta hydrolase [Paraburkholderia dipogonis]
MNSPFFREAQKSRLEAARNPTWERMEKVFEGLIAKHEQRLPDLLGLRMKIYSQPGMGKTMENIFNGLESSWSDGYITDDEARSVKCPYLIYAAVDHKDIFLECSYEYAKLIPKNRLVELKGASHWPQWEAHQEFNRINLEFLRG